MHFEAMNMNNGHVSLLMVMRVPVWLCHPSPKCHTTPVSFEFEANGFQFIFDISFRDI